MIEVQPKMVTILRRLHFASSKSVQCNWRYHGRQFEKRGFEINAFEAGNETATVTFFLPLQINYRYPYRYHFQQFLTVVTAVTGNYR